MNVIGYEMYMTETYIYSTRVIVYEHKLHDYFSERRAS